MAVRIENVSVGYRAGGDVRPVVSHVTLDVKQSEIVGIVGESGCGKSTLALTLLRLLPENAEVLEGEIFSEGVDTLKISEEDMRHRRGAEIAMIFQDPFAALNPVITVGAQLVEAISVHQKLSRNEQRARAVELLRDVEIRDPERRFSSYPHQLSGGERQRIVIAMAIANRPKLLVADEPTTALDVTVQKEILLLLQKLREEYGMSILLITHNFGIVAEMCDRVAVMYAGRLVEVAAKSAILTKPLHPYTKALLKSIPRIGERGRIQAISGRPPDPGATISGCKFAPRCEFAIEKCGLEEPVLEHFAGDHSARCIRANELA